MRTSKVHVRIRDSVKTTRRERIGNEDEKGKEQKKKKEQAPGYLGLSRFVAADPAQQGLAVTLLAQADSATPAASGSRGGGGIGTAPVGVGGIGGCGVGALLVSNVLGVLFVIAARILGVAGAEDADGDADNHGEPDDGQQLEGQQEAQEDPLDGAVHANGTVEVQERVEEVGELVGVTVVGDHFGGLARIAAVRHLGGHFLEDGPAEHGVEDVARDQPGDHENAERDVAGPLELEIFEDFGRLRRLDRLIQTIGKLDL